MDGARSDDPDATDVGRNEHTMPRWAKIFVVTGIVVAVLVVVVLVFSGGRHGPGRHMGMAGAFVGGSPPSQAPAAAGSL